MKQSLKVVALLMSCLAVSGCETTRRERFKPIPIPAERMDCQATTKADRPSLAPTYEIDWTKVATIDAARTEVGKLKNSVLVREGIIVGYILQLEDGIFACSSDAQWLRDYTSKIEQ